MGKGAMIVKESSCSVHVIRVKVHLKKKIKSLIWKQAWTVNSCTGTIMKIKKMAQELLNMSIFY